MANKLVITNMVEDKNKLEHYGVKGMKWGVRKSEAAPIKSLEAVLLTVGIIAIQQIAQNINNNKIQRIRNDASLSVNSLKDLKKIEPPESFLDSLKKTNDIKSSNMNYKMNCTNTTMAYELRRRGYDVKAKPSVEGLSMSQAKDAYNISKADLVLSTTFDPSKNKYNTEILNNYFQSTPDGYRGAIGLVWASGYGGHIFNVEKINNKMMFIDSQDGTYGEFKNLNIGPKIKNKPANNPSMYLDRALFAEIFRIDNAKIKEEYLAKQLVKG